MIEYAPEAVPDVETQHDFLLERSVRAAERFMAEIKTAENSIEARPYTWKTLSDGSTRRYSFYLRRTSFHIDYVVERTKNRHSARLAWAAGSPDVKPSG
jgi:hypothetical protein